MANKQIPTPNVKQGKVYDDPIRSAKGKGVYTTASNHVERHVTGRSNPKGNDGKLGSANKP